MKFSGLRDPPLYSLRDNHAQNDQKVGHISWVRIFVEYKIKRAAICFLETKIVVKDPEVKAISVSA